RVKTTGELNAEGGKITVDAQGADFSGTITASDGEYNMNDGDTNIGNTFMFGNQSFEDNINVTVTGNVVIANGNLTIRADNNNASGITLPGTPPTLDTGGDFVQDKGTFIMTTTAGKKVTIRSGSDENNGTGNVTVGTIFSAGDVELTAAGGAVDRTTGTLGITGGNLKIKAANGIGMTNTIQSLVSSLEALNTTSGDVNLSNLGALTVNGNGITNNDASGNVNLTNVADLTLEGAVTTGDTASLNVTGAIYDKHAGVDVTADKLELNTLSGIKDNGAGDNILDTQVNSLAAKNTLGGDVNISNTGDIDITAVGSTTGVTNNLGNVGIETSGNLAISETVQALDTVKLSAGGAITGKTGVATHIAADKAELLAANGIGSANAINTAVSEIATHNTTSGDINVSNTGNLDITLVGGTTGVTNDAGNIGIETTGNLGINEKVQALGNTVKLTAGGAITGSALRPTHIAATRAELAATNGIGSSNAIKTEVSKIEAVNTTSGNIMLDNTGNLTVTGAGVDNQASDGDVYLTTRSDLTLESAVKSGDLVSLDVDGALYDKNSSGEDIVADKLAMKLKDGIKDTVVGDDVLETQVSDIAAENSSTGTLKIKNTGDLDITTVTTLSGDMVGITNSAAGQAVGVESTGILKVTPTGQVVTAGGDIDLKADGDLYVNNIATNGGVFDGSAGVPIAGTVTLTSVNGDIKDNYDENPTIISGMSVDDVFDITAKDVIFNALNGGIGGGDLAPIEYIGNAVFHTTGDLSLFHRGVLHLAAFAGNSFSFVNSGDLYVDGAIITTGDVNLQVIDDPDLYVNTAINSGGTVNLSATGNVIIDKVAVTAANNINVAAGAMFAMVSGTFINIAKLIANNDVNVTAASVGMESSATIEATGGAAKIDATSGDATMKADSHVSAGTTSEVTATGALKIEKDSTITGGSGATAKGGSVEMGITSRVEATNGDATVEATNGDVTMWNASRVTAGGATGNATVKATNGGITMWDNSHVTAGANAEVTATGAVKLEEDSTIVGGSGAIAKGSRVEMDRNSRVEATNGDATVEATNGDVTMWNASRVTAGGATGNATVKATNGGITMWDNSHVTAGANAEVTATG
ncbi:MAG: hypothetical protein PHH49_05275, partial [Candidatus Omnitrophica bacterium]|nr:hypothetical protein [Candidatus Omnitrophota bacterium]